MTRRPLLEQLRRDQSMAADKPREIPATVDDERVAAYLDDALTAEEIAAVEQKWRDDEDRVLEIAALDRPAPLNAVDEQSAVDAMRSALAATLVAPKSRKRGWVRWSIAVAAVAGVVMALIVARGERDAPIIVDHDRVIEPVDRLGEDRTETVNPVSPETLREMKPVSPMIADDRLRLRPPTVPMPVEQDRSRQVVRLATEPELVLPTVGSVRGLAFRRVRSGWLPITEGARFEAGDIAVPFGGQVKLSFINGGELTIDGGSRLTLSECVESVLNDASQVRVVVESGATAKLAYSNVPAGSVLTATSEAGEDVVLVTGDVNTEAGITIDSGVAIANVWKETARLGETVVNAGRSRLPDGTLVAIVDPGGWRRKPANPWTLSRRTTDVLAQSTEMVSDLLAVRVASDIAACTKMAIELGDASVFETLANSSSRVQQLALRDWLLTADAETIRSKNPWSVLGRDSAPVENWFTLWRRKIATGRTPVLQRAGLNELFGGLTNEHSRFARETAADLIRDLTKKPLTSYDASSPTAAGIAEAGRALDGYWNRVRRSQR